MISFRGLQKDSWWRCYPWQTLPTFVAGAEAGNGVFFVSNYFLKSIFFNYSFLLFFKCSFLFLLFFQDKHLKYHLEIPQNMGTLSPKKQFFVPLFLKVFCYISNNFDIFNGSDPQRGVVFGGSCLLLVVMFASRWLLVIFSVDELCFGMYDAEMLPMVLSFALNVPPSKKDQVLGMSMSSLALFSLNPQRKEIWP